MEKNAKHVDGTALENIFPNAEEAIENAKAKGTEYWKNAKMKWASTKGFIQKHPAQAVGYAVLLGLTVGMVLFPKKRQSL